MAIKKFKSQKITITTIEDEIITGYWRISDGLKGNTEFNLLCIFKSKSAPGFIYIPINRIKLLEVGMEE